MIHSELCSACGGPLQLGVGLVLFIIMSIIKHSTNFLKTAECNISGSV